MIEMFICFIYIIFNKKKQYKNLKKKIKKDGVSKLRPISKNCHYGKICH